MKIYGWDDLAGSRGDMEAAITAPEDAALIRHSGVTAVAPGGLVAAYTSFAEAKRALMANMKEAGTPGWMIDMTRRLRAGDVPVVFDAREAREF